MNKVLNESASKIVGAFEAEKLNRKERTKQETGDKPPSSVSSASNLPRFEKKEGGNRLEIGCTKCTKKCRANKRVQQNVSSM